MNKTQRIIILMALALVASTGLRAQTTGTTTGTPTGTTTGGTTTGGTTTGGTTTGGTTTGGTTTGGTTTGGTTTTTPGGGTTTTTPGTTTGKANGKAKGPNENASDRAKEVHDVIAQFQLQRDKYLADRKLLLDRLATATEAQKKEILEQLRNDKAARENEERSLGKQIREELKDLRKRGGS